MPGACCAPASPETDAMDMLYLLVPMSLVLVAVIAGALWWALHAGQYDDLDRPGEAILLDNDRP
ncbi:hypothetical protein CS8_068080 [Cupriavidus sp. 8B]